MHHVLKVVFQSFIQKRVKELCCGYKVYFPSHMDSDCKECEKKLVIGLMYPKDKFMVSAFAKLPEKADVTWLDPLLDLEEQAQGKDFNVIIVKLTDWLNSPPRQGHITVTDHSHMIVERVKAFLDKRPNAKVLDPVENTVVLKDRKLLAEKLGSLKFPDGLSLPPHVVLTTKPDVPPPNMVIPCIIKPFEACGTSLSHKLTVVREWDSLKEMDELYFPAIAEAMVPHDVIAKSNVIMCRKSGPIVLTMLFNDVLPEGGATLFDSQQHTKGMEMLKGQTFSKAENEIIKETCKVVCEGLGLTVLGLDFIKNKDTGALFLVDVNFFPACSKQGSLEDYLLKACEEL